MGCSSVFCSSCRIGPVTPTPGVSSDLVYYSLCHRVLCASIAARVAFSFAHPPSRLLCSCSRRAETAFHHMLHAHRTPQQGRYTSRVVHCHYILYRLVCMVPSDRPDLTVQLSHFPHMSVWMFPFAGLVFSLGNAAIEEFVYRGIILQALDSAAGSGFLSLLVQAWLFGALHFREGFPNGTLGVMMTVIYGIMLGSLRRRSQGMLAPWAVHVIADCVIFMILAGMVLNRAH